MVKKFFAGRHIKFYEQMQQTECGLCCVAMIMSYYGYNIDISELRAKYETGRDGASALNLKGILNEHGFRVKTFQANVSGLREVDLPAILFWEQQHFVVLKRIGEKSATVIDPEYGTVTYPISEFEQMFSELVICVDPEGVIEPPRRRRYRYAWIGQILKRNKRLYLGLILCSVGTYIGSIGVPVVIQNLIDSTEFEDFASKLLIVSIVAVAYVAVHYLNSILSVNLNANIDESLNKKIFQKILNLPYKFFDLRNKSDILISMSGGMVLKDVIVRQLINGVIECGAAVVIIIYLYMANPLLATVAVAVFVVELAVMLSFQFAIKDRGMAMAISEKKLSEIQTETVFSMMNVKLLSLENSIATRFGDRYDIAKRNYKKRDYLGTLLNTITFGIINMVPLLLLVPGMWFVYSGQMSVGKVMAFYSLTKTFFSLTGSICAMIISLINSTLYFDRIKDIMEQEERTSGTARISDMRGNISLENVCFSYTVNSKECLSDISLDIFEGEKVAIVGKSGSGKSTLVKLIAGLYTPTGGRVLFDGIDIEKADQSEIFKMIGIVPQDVMLFNKSIYDNVVAGRDGVGIDHIVEACKIAGIAEDIEKMPMKYNTIISDMGMNLSGGQRQRLALARALIGNPKILILDEATSSLDTVFESQISERLERLKMTRVIVAHRLSTVLNADRIVVMEDGKIVDIGTHNELLKRCSQYHELYSKSVGEEKVQE